MALINGAINLSYSILALILLVYSRSRTVSVTKVTSINTGILSAAFLLLLFNGTANCFFHDRPIIFLTLIALSFVNYYMVLAWYSFYIVTVLQEKNKFTFLALAASIIVCAAGSLVWIATCIKPVVFDITRNEITNIRLYCLSQIPGVLSILIDLILLFVYRSKLNRVELFSLTMIPLTLPVSLLFHYIIPGIRLRPAMIFILILWNHFIIGSKRDRELWRKEEQLKEYRYILSLERVKPHYIYNVLSSIYYLCDQNPEKAQQAIKTFSQYLRKSLYTMDDSQLVPFRWEYELIRNYLSLEMLRFRDHFRVEYDIRAEDFELPPFSVQILVENAVKHGVSRRPDNEGIIRIATEALPGGYAVTITDNGSGTTKYNQEPYDLTDNNDHFGLSNVRERLSALTGGSLTIGSNPEGGITSSLFIPDLKSETRTSRPGSVRMPRNKAGRPIPQLYPLE